MTREIYSVAGFAEPVSSILHLTAAAVFLACGTTAFLRSRTRAQRTAVLAFSASAVFVFSMSGMYHLLAPGSARTVLQRLDHAGIYIMIAGTFTAVHTLLFRRMSRWGVIALVWLLAAASISLSSVYFTSLPPGLRLLLYLGFGWLGLFTGVAVSLRYGFSYFLLLLLGGLAYTSGAVLDFVGRPILLKGVVEAHELFHFWVAAGAACHWLFIKRAIAGIAGRKEQARPEYSVPLSDHFARAGN